jgi:hypothetical protein
MITEADGRGQHPRVIRGGALIAKALCYAVHVNHRDSLASSHLLHPAAIIVLTEDLSGWKHGSAGEQ